MALVVSVVDAIGSSGPAHPVSNSVVAAMGSKYFFMMQRLSVMEGSTDFKEFVCHTEL